MTGGFYYFPLLLCIIKYIYLCRRQTLLCFMNILWLNQNYCRTYAMNSFYHQQVKDGVNKIPQVRVMLMHVSGAFNVHRCARQSNSCQVNIYEYSFTLDRLLSVFVLSVLLLLLLMQALTIDARDTRQCVQMHAWQKILFDKQIKPIIMIQACVESSLSESLVRR